MDGGSDDGTLEIARKSADRVLSAQRGRACQMNAGAQVATGESILFLHADTLPPPGFPHLIEQALTDPDVVGGRRAFASAVQTSELDSVNTPPSPLV